MVGKVFVSVEEKDFDVSKELDKIKKLSSESGAAVLFVGKVRQNKQEKLSGEDKNFSNEIYLVLYWLDIFLILFTVLLIKKNGILISCKDLATFLITSDMPTKAIGSL